MVNSLTSKFDAIHSELTKLKEEASKEEPSLSLDRLKSLISNILETPKNIQSPQEEKCWTHITDTVKQLAALQESFPSVAVEKRIEFLAQMQFLILKEKQFLASQREFPAPTIETATGSPENILDHLQLLQVQLKDNDKKVARYKKVKHHFELISTDVLFGKLGQKAPHIRQAAMDGDPSYIDWRMKAAIVQSVVSYLVPLEIFRVQDLGALRLLRECIDNEPDLLDVYIRLWNPDDMPELQSLVTHLLTRFHSNELRPIITEIQKQTSFEQIAYQHYLKLFKDSSLDLSRINLISDKLEKGEAYKAYINTRTAVQDKIEALRKLCEERIPLESPALQDFVIETIVNLNSTETWLEFIPYAIEYPYRSFELDFQRKVDSELMKYLERISQEELEALIRDQFNKLADHFVKKDKLKSLFDLYTTVISLDSQAAKHSAYLLLKPYFKKHANDQEAILKGLLMFSRWLSSVSDPKTIETYVGHANYLLKSTCINDLDNVVWVSWFKQLSEQASSIPYLFHLMRIYAPYIHEDAIEISWNTLLDNLRTEKLELSKETSNTLKILFNCAKKDKEAKLLDLHLLGDKSFEDVLKSDNPFDIQQAIDKEWDKAIEEENKNIERIKVLYHYSTNNKKEKLVDLYLMEHAPKSLRDFTFGEIATLDWHSQDVTHTHHSSTLHRLLHRVFRHIS